MHLTFLSQEEAGADPDVTKAEFTHFDETGALPLPQHSDHFFVDAVLHRIHLNLRKLPLVGSAIKVVTRFATVVGIIIDLTFSEAHDSPKPVVGDKVRLLIKTYEPILVAEISSERWSEIAKVLLLDENDVVAVGDITDIVETPKRRLQFARILDTTSRRPATGRHLDADVAYGLDSAPSLLFISLPGVCNESLAYVDVLVLDEGIDLKLLMFPGSIDAVLAFVQSGGTLLVSAQENSSSKIDSRFGIRCSKRRTSTF